LEEYLRARFPHRFPQGKPERVRAFVDRTLADAEMYGVKDAGSLTELARLRASYGEQFEWTPGEAEALEILSDPELPGAVKVHLLSECLDGYSGGRPVLMPAGEED